MAERHAERQSEQHETLARQSQALIEESQNITAAAQELVGQDALARTELLKAQRELQSDLQTERSSLDRQREQVEQERRRLAESRHRAPIIAEAMREMGLLVVCLLPLILVAYALSQGSEGPDVSDELNGLLITDLTADRPLLLPRPALANLEHPSPDRANETPAPGGADS